MKKLKKGTRVRVINKGRNYSTYEGMFKQLGFKNTEHNAPSEDGSKGNYVVKNSAKHEDTNKLLYHLVNINEDTNKLLYHLVNINDDTDECLIQYNGVEPVSSDVMVSPEFIKEAYNDACRTWKSKLEDKFPDIVGKPLEVGDWAKWTGIKPTFGVIGKVYSEGCYAFKFTIDKDLSDGSDYNSLDKMYLRKVGKDEIEKLLNKEAEKRGFLKDGAEFKSLDDGGLTKLIIPEGTSWDGFSGYRDGYGNVLFNNGKWAEVSERVEMTLKDIESKLGYNIKIIS